jgi:hypothetical protein
LYYRFYEKVIKIRDDVAAILVGGAGGIDA